MTDLAATETKIRMLVNAQTVDDQWFSEAAKVLGIDESIIKREQWNLAVWNQKHGEVGYSTTPKVIGSYWVRPDGATTMFINEDIGDPARIVKYALLGELIDVMRQTGRLSFASVGYPPEASYCKVYLDGAEQDKVVEADALVGRIEKYKRDRTGRLLHRDGDLVCEQFTGKVEIVVQQERQAFF